MPVTCGECDKVVQVVDGYGRVWVIVAPYCNACRPGSVVTPEYYARLRSAGTLAQHQLSVEASGPAGRGSADRAVQAIRDGGRGVDSVVIEVRPSADAVANQVAALAQTAARAAAAAQRLSEGVGSARPAPLYCERPAADGTCRRHPGHPGACDVAPPRALDLDDRHAAAAGGLDAGAQARFRNLEIDEGGKK